MSVCVEVENPQQHGMGAPAAPQHPWDHCWLHLPPSSLPTQAMAMPRAGPKTTGPQGEAVPGAAGAVPVPGAVLVRARRSGGGAPVGAPWGAEGCPWLSVRGCC